MCQTPVKYGNKTQAV